MSTFDKRRREFDDPVAAAVLPEEAATSIGAPLHLIDPAEPAIAAINLALIQVASLGFDIADEAVAAQAVTGARRRHAEEVHREHLRQIRNQDRLARAKHPSVVYYMRIGNRVKIGYSTNLPARVASVMPEEVLATEAGGRLLEDVRHRQFDQLRVIREWFRYEEPLAGHIARLAEKAA